MSKKKKSRKLEGNSHQKKVVSTSSKPKVVKTTSNRRTSSSNRSTKTRTRRKEKAASRLYTENDMLFSKENYILMAGGIFLIIIGFLLMRGGAMPDADTWNADEIYSFRRTVLAPVLVVAGLIVEIVAIFRNQEKKEENLASGE